jgi:hypothetical protein
MNEQEIRDGLKRIGFLKIRKKYGQHYMPIISADKNGMRIWVEVPTGEYQTSKRTSETLDRVCGRIEDLLKF